jgi:hypothetical protein
VIADRTLSPSPADLPGQRDRNAKKVDEMLVTPTGLRTTPNTVNGPIPQTSSAGPSVKAATAEVLISTQQVLFGTAVVQDTRRAPLGSRIAATLRHMVADANRPRQPYLRHYGYIEDARMARAMERL